ncbi:MAG: HAD-IB family phosphatase, partial [Pseudomonadota bacterium]|nr:HAD-IB family phosphatase [Pseudomonadota bacterium]
GRGAPRERFASAATGARHAGWTVLCDFDGTITLDVTDSLLLRFGRPGWEALEVEWRAGRIGSRECMAGQIALLDCSREELDEHLAPVEIDPAFVPFVAAVAGAGVRLCIVSDGLDLAIASILDRHGIEGIPVFASRLVQSGARGWRLEFPHARAGCASATCKCAHALSAASAPERSVLVIGDGESDVCVAGSADLVFARKRLLDHCEAAGLVHRRTNDFAAALREWQELDPLSPGTRTLGNEETLDA